jgi:hypothetical protein
MKENVVRRHLTELRGQADLGEKPQSVQPIRREISRVSEQTGENPIEKHVQKLKSQAEPVYSQERIDEARKKWPVLSTEEIIRNLKQEPGARGGRARRG